jgi:hypothetical protein
MTDLPVPRVLWIAFLKLIAMLAITRALSAKLVIGDFEERLRACSLLTFFLSGSTKQTRYTK